MTAWQFDFDGIPKSDGAIGSRVRHFSSTGDGCPIRLAVSITLSGLLTMFVPYLPETPKAGRGEKFALGFREVLQFEIQTYPTGKQVVISIPPPTTMVSIPTRFSRIDCGIGPTLDLATVAEIFRKKATHISLHANKIKTLDLYVSPQYLGKNKEEDALRTGSQELVHVLELDLSSNSLHEGYTLPRPGGAMKVPLLGLCTNLITLNLASNGLSQHSFANNILCLARLQTLDISYNAFDKLPHELHTKCPSLKNLAAINNKLKSLTSLLQSLHKFRGKLETVQFTNKSAEAANNPVCSKDLYREKVIFVLGSRLVRLDCGIINASDREKARLKLERGLSIYSENSADETNVHNHTPPTSRGHKQPQHLAHGQAECDFQIGLHHEEVGVLHRGPRHTVENDAAAKRIGAIEEQLASLKVIIENQVSCTDRSAAGGCDDDVDSASLIPSVGEDGVKSSRSALLEERFLAMCQRQRAAAMTLMKIIIDRQRQQEGTKLHTPFTLWLISTRSHRNSLTSKEKVLESEKKWQFKAAELVSKAIDEEIVKSKRKIELSDEKYEKTILHLTRKVKLLEGRLECQMKNEAESNLATNVLKSDFQRMEEAMKKDITDNKERARLAEVEVDRLHRELQIRTETLDKERNGRLSEIQRLTVSTEEVMGVVATNAAKLHQLKLEVIQKDVSSDYCMSRSALMVLNGANLLNLQETIKSIKDAYEHAARRSAADRSRCEQALVSEQQSKDLLCRQTIKLRNTEAEMGRVVADHHSRQTDNASRLSILLLEVEEKDQKIKEAEWRMKSILEEHDSLQKQLMECSRIKSRTEERNNNLEAQLDQAADDTRKAKLATVGRQQLDEAISRAADLKHSLDMVRESSQQRERQLETKNKENLFLRKKVESLCGKLQSAKRDRETREKQIESMHCAEIQKLEDQKDRELSSADNDLKAESELTDTYGVHFGLVFRLEVATSRFILFTGGMRLELERKAAALETDNEKQKLKMRNAMEGLAKQLAGA